MHRKKKRIKNEWYRKFVNAKRSEWEWKKRKEKKNVEKNSIRKLTNILIIEIMNTEKKDRNLNIYRNRSQRKENKKKKYKNSIKVLLTYLSFLFLTLQSFPTLPWLYYGILLNPIQPYSILFHPIQFYSILVVPTLPYLTLPYPAAT